MTDEYRATRRAGILQAAARCFAHNGFHSTSMADVISESGLSAGAVYLYFRSKEEIIGAVAEQTLHTADEVFAGLLADGAAPAPADVLTVFVESISNATVTGPDADVALAPLTLQVWTEALRNRDLGGRLNDAYLRLRAHFAEVARRWRDAGNLPSGAVPEQVGAALLGLTQGFLLQHVLTPNITPEDYLAGLHALLPPGRANARNTRPRRSRRSKSA